MSADILTKAQFARLIGRHAAFVSRAIASGALHGPALVGEGRTARIRADIAMQQLGRALDVSQQLAQERPILPQAAAAVPADAGEAPVAAAAAAELDLPAPASVPVAATDAAAEANALADARQQQLDLRNRKIALEIARAEREAAVEAGALVPVVDVQAALRRQLGPLVATFDEVPAAVAKAISEGHGVNYAEVLITVKACLRQQRAAWAERARGLARMENAVGMEAGVMA